MRAPKSGIVLRALRVDGDPEVRFAPALEVADPRAEAGCEEFTNAAEVIKGSVAEWDTRCPGSRHSCVSLAQSGSPATSEGDLQPGGAQVIDESVEARDLAGVIGAPILASSRPQFTLMRTHLAPRRLKSTSSGDRIDASFGLAS